MKYGYVLMLSFIFFSCSAQEKKSVITNSESTDTSEEVTQIGQYVTGVYEDATGNLWFGTIQKGIGKYDGDQLRYYTVEDGLPSNRVPDVIQDSKGVYWFSTDQGIVKYDGVSFTNFTVKENDWHSNSISQIFIDSKGKFWVGTWGGVYQFDGKAFTHFPIPYPEVETSINEDTKNWITEIKEDSEGNLWFARDGYGIAKFDGTSFTHYLKRDGLISNHVTEIEIDNDNTLWFGMRNGEQDNSDPEKRSGKGGVSQLTGKTITSISEVKALNVDDVYEIFKDRLGNIWIGTTKNGVFKYDGQAFESYKVPISIMSMVDDEKGNLWLGGAGGLFRIDKNGEVVNVTTTGPWK